MSLEKYEICFAETLGVRREELDSLSYQSIPSWDSVGHMQLMTVLEDAFSIQLEIDDIIDFSDFNKGKSILQKYGVNFD